MAPRALALPAIAVAVLPKCPVCVMVALTALGLGHGQHETVFTLLQGAALAAVVTLLLVRRRGARVPIALAAAGACGVLLMLAGVAWPSVGYAGAVLLAAAWLVKPRSAPAPSCACAATEGAST